MNEKSLSGQEVKSKKLVGPKGPVKARPLGLLVSANDQGYGRGGTLIFTDVFEPLARVALYPTDEDGLGTCFGAA